MAELTKSQQNDLWRAIKAGGLDPGACELESAKVPAKNLFRILYSSSNDRLKRDPLVRDRVEIKVYSFAGYIVRPYVYDSRARTTSATQIGERNQRAVDWLEVLSVVQAWAVSICDRDALRQAHEVEAEAVRIADEALPDLWTLGFDPGTVAVAVAPLESDDNRPFTVGERTQIASQLRGIKQYLKENFELTGERLERVETQLDATVEASQRLGRRDWLLLFMGTAVSLAASQLVPPDAFPHIVATVLHGLAHMFETGRPHVPRKLLS
jgi:hypothetical protein